MNARIIGFCLMSVVSCGGRVAPTTEVTTEAKADALISYVVGYCTGTPGRPRCGYSREDYRASPCCAPSAEMRANADTYTAYSDCTVVQTRPSDRGPTFSQSWKLTHDGCVWLKSAVTDEVVAAVDDPAACTATPLGKGAITLRDSHGHEHHKELVSHCNHATLGWLQTSFWINCVYSHQ